MLAEGGVTIGRIDFDKYGGRVVASAATRNTPDVSDALLKTGYVRAYDGGRRETWCGSQSDAAVDRSPNDRSEIRDHTLRISSDRLC